MKYILLTFSITLHILLIAQVTADAGPDKQICLGDTLKVTGSGLNSGDTGSYQWKDLNNNIVMSNSASLIVKITAMAQRSYELTVNRLHNTVNYSDKDTFILNVVSLPTFIFKGIPPRCYDDGAINLTYGIIATAVQGNDTSKKFYDLRYYQRFKNPGWITGGPIGTAPHIYNYPKFITNAQVPSTGLRDTICYDFTDVNGCYNYECKPVRINPNPEVQVVGGMYCQLAGPVKLDNLVQVPSNKTGGIQSWRCLDVPQGSGVDKNSIISQTSSPVTYSMDPGLPGENNKTGDYILEYCFKNPITACQRCDTTTVKVIRLPEVEFDTIPGQCINGPLLALDSFVHDKTTGKRLNGAWQCVEYGGSRDLSNPNVKNAINNSVKSQKYFDPKTIGNGGNYLLKLIDLSSGCPVSDSINVIVNGLPLVSLDVPDSVCLHSGQYQLLSNYPTNDTSGFWLGESVSADGKLNSDNYNLGTDYSKTVKTRFIYKHPLTNCTNTDSAYVTVIKRPVFKLLQIIQPNSRFIVDFAVIDSNMNLSNFKWLWDFSNGSTSMVRAPKGNIYLDSGTFTVYLTLDNGLCKTKDSVTFQLNYKTSSINDVHMLHRVYPNPVNSELSVNLPVDGTLYLYDINGKLLLTEEVISNNTEQIDMRHMEKGVYLLVFRNEETNFYIKVIRE